MLPENYRLQQTDWECDREHLVAIRKTVFMEEQQVPESDEWDGLDDWALHFLLLNPENKAIGCARIIVESNTCHIGRLAVYKAYRGRGLGRRLMQSLLDWCDDTLPETTAIVLNAQTHLIDFYQTLGFQPEGEVFMDAGIPHQRMYYAPVIAEHSGPVRLNGLASFQEQVVQVCQTARRRIRIVSRALDPALYDQPALCDAISELARRHRQSEIQILVSDVRSLLERGHNLLKLAQRLSTKVAIRRASEEYESQGQEFLLCDQSQLLVRVSGNDYRGYVSLDSPAEARKLHEQFERDWQQAHADPRLRRLFL